MEQSQDRKGVDNLAYTAEEPDSKRTETSAEHGEKRVEVKRSQRQRKSCYGAYANSLLHLTRSINQFYFNVTHMLVKHPYTCLPTCIFLAGLCCVGIIRLQPEGRVDKLYVPQNSQAMKDQDKILPYFDTQKNLRIEDILFMPKPGNEMMTRNCIQEAKDLVNEVLLIPGYENVCSKKPSYINRYKQYSSTNNCSLLNPFELIGDTYNPLEEFNKAMTNNVTLMSNGKLPIYNLYEMVARTKKIQNQYTEVNTIRVVIYMQQEDDDSHAGTDTETAVEIWEGKFLDLVHEKAERFKCATVMVGAHRSLNDEVNNAVSSDIALAAALFIIMITFACVLLGKITNVIRGHSILALFGVLSTGLGIGAGFGFAIGINTPYVSIVGILPFLVLSIGIDDMFIIVDEFDKHNDEPDPVQRIPKAMQRIGATITMTTLTDITAFALSVLSDFPAIKHFCTFAALTFTIEFILQVTLFVVFLSFDARRIRANRRECLPFCKGDDRIVCMKSCLGENNENLSNIIVRKYATILVKWPTKIIVLLLTCGLLAGGIYGCFHVSQEFTRRSLVADGAPFLEFLDMIETEFGKGLPVDIIKVGAVDYSDKKLQDQLNQVAQVAYATGFYQSKYISWLYQYKQWSQSYNVNIDGANFTRMLPAFLSSPTTVHFYNDLRFNERGEVVASRTQIFSNPTTNSEVLTEAMLILRDEFKSRKIDLIPYSSFFIYFEQFAVVMDEVLRNLCLAAGAVLIITLPFCINPVVVLLLLFSFASLIIELIGLMYLWNVSINCISMINLVMSIGFSIDYSAHVAHAFVMSEQPTANERAIDALSSIGASVFMGGASTFLGMLATAFASSEIFRIFFRMTFGIVVFGLFNGLVVLPVLFSTLGFMIGPVNFVSSKK